MACNIKLRDVHNWVSSSAITIGGDPGRIDLRLATERTPWLVLLEGASGGCFWIMTSSRPIGKKVVIDSVAPSTGAWLDQATQAETEAPAVRSAGETSRRAVMDVVHLRQGSFAERWEAAKQMPQMGEAAIADLVAILNDGALSWEARWLAARSLGYFDQPTVITALIETLTRVEDALDEDLQAAIIQALGHIGPSAIAVLSTLLAHPAHRAAAIEALIGIPHPATMMPLVTVVGQTEGGTKAKVIEALGQLADPDQLPLFTNALNDQASTVRLAALQGLIILRRQVDETQWVAWIQPLVNDINLAVAQRAIHALGRTPAPAATQILQGILGAIHTPDILKIDAVRALAWQDTAAALTALLGAWKTSGQNVRIALVQGLSQMTQPSLKTQMINPVQQWLTELPATAEHSLLRRNLVMVLGQVGGDSVLPILYALSQDSDAGVRLHAAAALQQG